MQGMVLITGDIAENKKREREREREPPALMGLTLGGRHSTE